MANKTQTKIRSNTPKNREYDSVYFLKILLYLIIGSFWILTRSGNHLAPVGLIAGVLLVQHENLQIDRKIEYAILLIGTVLGLIGVGLTYTP